MSEYNIDNNILGKSSEKNQNYLMATLAGFGTSVLVAIALTAIGIWLEAEYILILVIGAVLVGVVIHNFVPNNHDRSYTWAILCPATYILYQVFMVMFGYSYEENDNYFWWMLAGSFIYGSYMGYNNED